MGVLSAAESTGNGVSHAEPDLSSMDEGGSEETPAVEPQQDVNRDEKGQFVKYDDVAQKPSRRNKAAEAIEQKFKEFESRYTTQQQQAQERLAAMQAENARLQGQIEALSRMPQQASQKQEPAEDADAIEAQALKALDDKDVTAYHKLSQKAARVRARLEAEQVYQAKFSEIEKRIPQQLPPPVVAMIHQHPGVASEGDRGLKLVEIEDQKLEWMGIPRGHERLSQAFKNAEAQIKAKTRTAPTFSQSSAGALSGAPAGRSTANTEEAGETLTAQELEVAKAMKWSPQEYVKWKNPGKFVKSRW